LKLTSFSFPKTARLLNQKHFRDLSKFGKQHFGKFVIVQYSIKDYPNATSRLGVTVSKKFGKAHVRNRFKRLVREAFRLIRPSISTPVILNVKPRERALNASMQEIQQELMFAVGISKSQEETLSLSSEVIYTQMN